MKTDAVLTFNEKTRVYDISFDEIGDIKTADFFDTILLYAIFGEKRATASEVSIPELRRGWIGNEGKDFENGSKIWQFEQERLTRTILSKMEDTIRKSLAFLVDDNLALSIDEVTVIPREDSVQLSLVIKRTLSKVEKRLFTLWNNTGLQGELVNGT